MDKEVKKIISSFIPATLFVSILWIIKFMEWKTGHYFTEYGVLPRTLSGMVGIITSPLLHGSFQHLISNSIPMLILGAGITYFYRDIWLRVFAGIYLLSGIWLWMGGRESYHIGASGLVYGLTAFLFFSGMFRRDTRLMAISMLVVFLYGGMVWGIFPLFREVSWEAHLFGAFAGVLYAFAYRKEGPQRKLYEWETTTEDDIEDDENAYWKLPAQKMKVDPPSGSDQVNVNINYIYRPAPEQKSSGNTTADDHEKN